MRTSRPWAATTLCISLALSACGGDDDEPDAEPAGQPAAEPAAGDGDGEEATITIADFAFAGVTEVTVGTTVTVTNDESTTHTWTALDGSFDSGALGQGDTFEFTFTEPGEFAYQCNFHPSMTGAIVVRG